MTKSTITRERLQEIAEDGFLKHGESKELARMALAAMDSEPVAVVEPSDYVTAAHLVGEGPARKAVHELYEGALRIGDKLYRHAQPAPELKPIGYLFVSDQGAIAYSPTNWGMPGFRLAGQIYGDIDAVAQPAPAVEPVRRFNADEMHRICLEANRHLDKYGAMAKEVNKLLGRIPAQPAQPLMFIDGDISSESADKLAKVIREFNDEDERPLAKMARIIRENPHPTNECDMPKAQPAPERDQVRREHAEWSKTTFGNVGPVGPLKHLSKEALEAAAEPGDLSEWADMQFLMWDAQRRAGITDEQITKAMIEKLAVNKARVWPEPKDGEPRLHIKEQPAPVVPDDNDELARLAEKFGAEVAWANEPNEFHHLIEFTPPQFRAALLQAGGDEIGSWDNGKYPPSNEPAQPVPDFETVLEGLDYDVRCNIRESEHVYQASKATYDACRHAQQPVVPEEKPMPNTLSMYAVDAVAAIAEVKGWNACRAAMLNHPSSIQPNTDAATGTEIKHPSSNSPVIPEGWQVEAEKLAEMHGMSFVLFRHGEAPQCADPTKVVISFTDKGPGHDMLPACPAGGER